MIYISEGKDVKIVSTCSGKVLQANGSADGAIVVQSWNKDDNDTGQRWRLIPAPGLEHQYQIENRDNGMVLEVLGESHESGARILLHKDKNGAHRRWRLIRVSDDECAIVNVNSNKAIDVSNASHYDNATIVQYEYWHAPQQRWRLITPDVPTVTRAVLTIVRNERVFFPIWLRYYSKFFQPKDIYVLDHQSTDGSTSGDGFVRIPLSQSTFGSWWQRDVVQRWQHDLVDQYNVVLYAEADEIVAPDPRHRNLGEYIDRFNQDFVTCQGYEILHMKEDEAPFDHAQQIFMQRSTWYHNPLYSKSLLARVPMLWNGGFHARPDGRTNHDPHLYLIHLHRMDYEICLVRNQERVHFPRVQIDLDEGWGYHNRIIEQSSFSDWFYHDSGTNFSIEPRPIPSHWRNLV